MGFFDRFSGKKTPPSSTPASASGVNGSSSASAQPGGVIPRLAAARELLEAKDLPGALAIYEEVLAAAGERADVLVTISGDLGVTGHVREIIELVAPRYDAERHGPATGLNVLQAYLAVRDADAAQHVLDILFSLDRPELEERLHGFSNAIAELIASDQTPLAADGSGGGAPPADAAKVALISISKPIWFYGLEALAPEILPAKEGRLRRIAFAQLALPGYPEIGAAMKKPEDELGRLSRGLPLWLAETFYFSPHYTPFAAVGVMDDKAQGNHYVIFGTEWSSDNLRQLVDTTDGGLDYICTGALRQQAGDYEVLLRLWEVKKFRERKTFTARWTPATADAVLLDLHKQVRTFMEWSPETTGLPYLEPAAPRAWLDTLSASLALFLVEKKILPAAQVDSTEYMMEQAAHYAVDGEAESLAFLALRDRAERLQIAAGLNAALADSPLIARAEDALG